MLHRFLILLTLAAMPPLQSRIAGRLATAGVATKGEPVLARYNAPFTPWFLRRNQIWLALR